MGSAVDIARLGIEVQSGSVRRASQDLSAFNRHSRDAGQATESLGRSSASITGAVKGMAVQVAAAAGGMAALTKAFGAADQYTNMQNRLLALGASHESAATQIQQLADIAKNTRAPLESTVELYSRLSLTADSLGASQSELMQFTETVGLALATSGTSAAQASGALTQLSQAMAGGVVRAEEFNSIIEGAPGLLMAVAEGMEGVNGDLGALRQLMLDGELTSEAFFDALLSQTEALETAFGNTTPTISSALGVLNDQFTLFIGSADQATGVTNSIAQAILILAENMDVAVPVFGAVAVGVAAISAPILAAGVAIGALAVAVITHWDEIEKAFGDGVDYVMGLGPRLVQALKDAGAAALQAARQIGADIIAGIRAGIEQKWTDLKSYVSGLGTGMLDSMKDALGIRSPSREFMEVGRYSVEGLEIGWRDNDYLITDAIGSTVDWMIDGFKGGFDALKGILLNSLKEMARIAIGNPIKVALTTALTGGAGAAAAGVPGGGGISSLFGGGGFLGLGGGAGSLFGGAGLLGMGGGSGFLGLGAGSGLATALGGGAFGAAASVALPILGVGLAVAGLFKKTEVLVAEGVRARIDGASLELDSYEKTKTNNGVGMSSGFDREFERLDDAVQSAVGARLDATIDALGAFGLGTDLTGFSFSKRTEIKDGETFEGESEEVIREALNAAVEYLAEGALELYQQAGEGLSDTLTRLSTAIQVVNPLVDRLGNHMLDMSLDGAAAASALIEAAGGLEAFAAETAFVFENFTLDAEKAHIAADELGIQMRALGVDTIPATHAAFMELVNAQDLATEGGREMYAALLDIAPLFVQVKGTAQEAADAAANELVPALDDVTNTSNDAAAAARELAAQQREQQSLLLQIARMTGNVAYIREQELAALSEANRPLQEYIYLLEDQADALDNSLAAARRLLTLAEDDLAAARTDEADAIRALDDAYADLDQATQSRIDTLQDEIHGYEDLIASAESALIALGAMSEVKTPLEQAQDAAAAFEAGISDLASAINRERSAIQSTISGLQSEADDLSAALFPENAAQDLIAAMQARDVMSDMLDISRRLNEKARDILRLNENIVEVQRQTALAELQAMLARGQIDQAGIDRLMEEAGTFNPDQFQTFEQMSFEQKKTVNVLNDLADLQDDLAREAQREEDARAAAARETALAQLDALLEQIAVEENALDALGALEAQWGLVEDQLSAAEIAANLPALKAAAEAAKADAVAFYTSQIADNEILKDAAQDQITELEGIRAEYGLIDDAILTVGQAIENLVIAQAGLQSAIQAVADAASAAGTAQDAVDAAQDAVDQATGGGGGSGVPSGMSSAEKRLFGILSGLEGASGAAALGAGAFGYFSEDNMNAILTDAGVSALSGLAADVAGVFRDTLGRNVDVAGLEYYIGQIEDNGLTLDEISTDIGGSVEALTKLIPGFATSVSEAIYGINLAANTAVGAATTAVNAAQDAAASAAAAANAAASTPVLTGGMYDVVVDAATGQTYGEYLAGVPSYANGTDNHPGGWARLHENEMVNLPKGTGVSTAAEVSQAAEERRKSNELLSELAARVRDQQVEAKRMRKILSKWDTIGQPGTAAGQVVTTEAAT